MHQQGKTSEEATLGAALAAKAAARDADRERRAETAAAWLESFGEAWQWRDGEAAGELFTDDATYWWGPFERVSGREAIVERWGALTADSGDVHFDFGVLGIEGPYAIAHWHAVVELDDRGGSDELDGMMCISIDQDGRCSEFREWWHRRRLGPDHVAPTPVALGGPR
ncbi:MAG: hypothetical protein JWM86_229 [Thermoleophilia bacterium]|nr:hypothetical protein [Thermoleophilia bacterium]